MRVDRATPLGRLLGRDAGGVRVVDLTFDGETALYRVGARVRDAVGAGAALLMLSPVLALIAFAVKMSSRGPVFFNAEVIGLGGQPFRWRKFRTMRVVPEEVDEDYRRDRYRAFVEGTPADDVPQKIIDHDRVTAVGRFLRRHSLDELPQLWNVVRGEMSLVGPRPCLPYEFAVQAPWQRLRYSARPGLTGLWQVYGRSRVGFDEMVLWDYCYSRRRSLWVDMRLIIRTGLIVIRGDGGI